MTDVERHTALEAIAAEVRTCTRCRLHEGRTNAVPGEGNPDTEVVFIGEGPGFNEDREGRPFVGRAGDFLVRLLESIGWRRDDVFIANVVKCRPPDNRDPEPDEIAACAPYLRRQLEVLDPALIVTLGRHSLGRFMPGVKIGQAHGTHRPVSPESGARDALAYALYHPAAALRTQEIARQSFADIAGVPPALLEARARRAASTGTAPTATAATSTAPPPAVVPPAGPIGTNAEIAVPSTERAIAEPPAEPRPAEPPPTDPPPTDPPTGSTNVMMNDSPATEPAEEPPTTSTIPEPRGPEPVSIEPARLADVVTLAISDPVPVPVDQPQVAEPDLAPPAFIDTRPLIDPPFGDGMATDPENQLTLF